MPSLTVKNLPDDLYQRLKQRAADEHRSINSQVIVCLERVLCARRLTPEEVLRRADALRNRLDVPPLTEEFLRQAKEDGRP